MSYDTILLASDGGEASDAALEHAVSFADAFGAILHVVYVLDVAEHAPGVEDPGENPELTAKRQRALTESAEQAEQAGVDVTATAVRGEGGTVAETILEYAREHDVDLVMLGTHGRSGLSRLLVGSVAEAVVRDAPVPVVTARPTTGDTDHAPRDP